MANTVTTAIGSKFLPILDEVYQAEAKSRILDMDRQDIDFVGVDEVKIRKIDMDGLGNVDRNGDLEKGAVTVTTQTHKLEIDRGTIFSVDPMDNEETQAVAFGRLGGEFLRTKVIPEIDAIRFSKLASFGGTTIEADLTDTTVRTAIDDAILKMDDDEVSEEGRAIFVSNEVVNLLEKLDALDKFVNFGETSGNIGRRVLSYKGIPLIKIPRARFYTKIELKDKADGFGYAKDATGKDLNFILVHVQAVKGGVIKYNPMGIISADANQTAFQDIMKFRIYHDCFILDNKKKGVYVHHKTTQEVEYEA